MLYLFSSVYKVEGASQRKREERDTCGQIMHHIVMLFILSLLRKAQRGKYLCNQMVWETSLCRTAQCLQDWEFGGWVEYKVVGLGSQITIPCGPKSQQKNCLAGRF